MRICMIAYTNYQYDPRVRREAEALVERGDEVDAICLAGPRYTGTKNVSGVRVYTVKVKKYKGDSIVSYLMSYLDFFFKATIKVTMEFLRKKYAIIQIHTMPDFIVFCALIPKIFGAKIILDIHDLVPELYMSKFKANEKNIVIKLAIFIEKMSVKFSHKAIAVHHPHRDALIKHGNQTDKFFILLNTPDPRIFHRTDQSFKRDDGSFKIIYHGTISRRHGLDVAIKAVAMLKDEIPSLKFNIIGDGDDLLRLIDLVDESSLQNIVYFSKKLIPMKDLRMEICNSDLGLIPIMNDIFTQYMLPTKLLEYIALGIPVIITETMTIKAYFDNTMVRYFQAGSVESLSACIKDLYYNVNKRESLVISANKFNKKYNWEMQKHNYYLMLDELVK